MTPFGPLLQDMWTGWRARPLTSVALALLGLSLGLAGGLGLRIWQQADAESRALLEAWPRDRITLQFTRPMAPEELALLSASLPEGRWWSQVLSGEVLWVDGSPPDRVFQGTGTPIPPESIHQARPAAWASPASGFLPGELGVHQGIAFQVWGVGTLPGGARLLLPRSLHPPPLPAPTQIEVEATFEELEPRIAFLPMAGQIQWLDHQQQRGKARAGFRRLTRNLTLLALLAGGLTALLTQTLIRFELNERRHEFALRRSLGARPGDILNQILTETFCTTGLPALLGILIFLPGQPSSSAYVLLLIPVWFLLSALPPARTAASLPPYLALKEG